MKDRLIEWAAIAGAILVVLLSALPYVLGVIVLWLLIKWLR